MGSCRLPYSHGQREVPAILPHLCNDYLKRWFLAHVPMNQFLWSMWSCQPGIGQNEPMWVMALSGMLSPCHKTAAETTQRDFMLCIPFSMTRKGQLILRAHGVKEYQQMAISRPQRSTKTYAWQCFTKWRLLAIKWWGKQLTLPRWIAAPLPLPCAAAWGRGWESSPMWCFCHPVAPPLSETFCMNWQCPML